MALAAGLLFDLPLRLLLGHGVVNSASLALAWLSPRGILANFCDLVRARRARALRRAPANSRPDEHVDGALGRSDRSGATTLWCRDSIASISPRAAKGPLVVFKPWVDGLYHAVHIRIFAESHGAATIEDFFGAGLLSVPARLYHYGAYLLPAPRQASVGHPFVHGLCRDSGAGRDLSSPAFLRTPSSARRGVRGPDWPGPRRCCLPPDGAQQGMQNPFMSYHWLTQISPSATFGLALIAVAWLFVVQGCKNGNRLQLISGWVLAAVAAFYKLHFVLASALLLWLVPVLFFRAPLGIRKRAAWGAAAAVVYVTGLYLGQKIPGFPLVRFDGSSSGEILRLIQTFARPSALKDFIVGHTGASFSWTSNLLFGIPYVLFTALGLFVPLLAFLVFWLRRRAALLDLLFPLLLVVNFLVMFFGLSLDFVRSTPDELSHRPIMMVYFFVDLGRRRARLLARGSAAPEPPRAARAARPRRGAAGRARGFRTGRPADVGHAQDFSVSGPRRSGPRCGLHPRARPARRRLPGFAVRSHVHHRCFVGAQAVRRPHHDDDALSRRHGGDALGRHGPSHEPPATQARPRDGARLRPALVRPTPR